MKDILKSLDLPLSVTAAMVIVSLLTKRNIVDGYWLVFVGSFILLWVVNYFYRRSRTRKIIRGEISDDDLKREREQRK